MAIPTFVEHGTKAESPGAISPAWATHIANDIGVLFVNSNGNDPVPVVTPVEDWTLIRTEATTGGGTDKVRCSVYWARATGSSEAAPTVPDVGNHQLGYIDTYRGAVATGSPIEAIDGGIKGVNSSVFSVPGAVDTTQADGLVFAVSSIGKSDGQAGWTNANLANILERADENTIIGQDGAIAYATGELATAGAIGSTTGTIDTDEENAMVCFSLSPTTVPIVGLEMQGWRWRADIDGLNVDTSGWLAAENVNPATIGLELRRRVRAQIANTTGSTITDGFKAQYNLLAGGWNDLHVTPLGWDSRLTTERIEAMQSKQYVDKAAASTSLLTTSSETFDTSGDGVGETGVTGTDVAIPAGGFVELEFCVDLHRVADGQLFLHDADTIEFRVVRDDGTVLDVYPTLPKATINHPPGLLGGVYPENPDVLGPFQDGNGALYAFLEASESDTKIMALKTTGEAGDVWEILDDAGRPTDGDMEGFTVVPDAANKQLLLAHHRNVVLYYEFNTSDHATAADQWELVDQAIDPAMLDTNEQQITMALRSDGTMIAAYVGDTTDPANDNDVWCNIRSAGGTWGTPFQVWARTNDGNFGVVGVLGDNDHFYLFAIDNVDGELYAKRVNGSTDALENIIDPWGAATAADTGTIIDATVSTGNSNKQNHTQPQYWLDVATPKILIAFVTGSKLRTRVIDVGTSGSVGAIGGIINDADNIQQSIATSRQPVASVIRHSNGKIYAFFTTWTGTGSRNGDLVMDVSDDDGATWGTNTTVTVRSPNSRIENVRAIELASGNIGLLYTDASGLEQNNDPTGGSDSDSAGGLGTGWVWWDVFVVSAGEPEVNAEQATETDSGTEASLLAEPVVAVEQGSEADSATEATLAAEPLVSAEQATETDTATEATLISERAVVAEQATETDSASEISLLPEPVVTGEQGVETDSAQEPTLAPEAVVAVELGTETDSATEANLVAEPVLSAEQASEADSASEAVLSADTTEPEINAEQGSEIDTGTEAVLAAEPVVPAEQGSESDTATEAGLVPEPLVSAEQGSEIDTAQEATLISEPAITVDQGSEVDSAQEITLAIEPVVSVEQASEGDTAAEPTLIAEPVLAVEQGSEIDTAVASVFGPAIGFTTEVATENDSAQEVTLAPEPLFTVELATDTSTAQEAVLTADPFLDAELASESDTATEATLRTDFTVELATETDSGTEASLLVEPVLAGELASEIDTAQEAGLAVEPVFAVESATENDSAVEVVLSVVALVYWRPEPTGYDVDPTGYVVNKREG